MLCTNTDMDKPWMCSGCLLLPGNLRVRVRMIWLGSGLVVRVRVKIRIRVRNAWFVRANHGLCRVVSLWIVQIRAWNTTYCICNNQAVLRLNEQLSVCLWRCNAKVLLNQ